MRPKLLKVSGLNSFVEEEEIDFTALTEKGLFGIFGPTGSGKSSILDALTIALYGRISRDTKEFINKETGELYVFFEFTLGGGNRYTVERKLQISDTGGYRTTLARLVAEKEGRERTFSRVNEIDNRIEEIIGLSHEDFMRTVVLPQGKFSRFLRLTGRERRDMLERILNLEEFGEQLMTKLKRRKNIRNEELQEIKGVLDKYEGVTAEKLAEEKEELKDLQTRRKGIAGKLREKRREYDRYKRIHRLQKELEEYRGRKEKLTEKQEEIEKKKEKVKRVQQALSIESDLRRYRETGKEIKINRKALTGLKEDIKELEEKRTCITGEYNNLREKKDRELPELAEKKVKIKTALALKEKNMTIENKITARKEEIAELEGEIKRLQSDLGRLDDEIVAQEEAVINKEEKIEILEVSSDYRESVASGLELEHDYQKAREQFKVLAAEREELTAAVDETEEKIKELKEELQKEEARLLQSYRREIKRKKEKEEKHRAELAELEAKIKSTRGELSTVRREIRERERENMAGVLARQLKEGKPCPVCGSYDHPDVAPDSNVDLSLKRKRETDLEKEVQCLQEREKKTAAELNVIEKNRIRLKEEKENRTATFATEINELADGNFDELPERDVLLKRREEISGEISTLRGSLKTNRANLQTQREKYSRRQKEVAELEERYRERLMKLEIEADFAGENRRLRKKDSQREQAREELKAVKRKLAQNKKRRNKLRDDVGELSEKKALATRELEQLKENLAANREDIRDKIGDREPEKYIREIRQRKEQLQEKIKRKQKKKNDIEEKINNKRNRKSTVEDRLKRLQEENGKLQRFLDGKIAEFKFVDIAGARTYLEEKDNIKQWQGEIENYEKEKTNLENNITRLIEQLQGDSVTEERWKEIVENKGSLEEKLEELQEIIGGQKTKINRLEEDLTEKKEKINKKEELEHKLSLIKEIDDLIRGKSFVEFVALRQLRYIAREASKRLMEITNNRYRLELNERGEFVICDLYNGGVKRDCNTLSGGETFLTSLSLALALSSQIQLKGKSRMEFFFLDEGFGTLDNNLLDIVMNSLEKLQDKDLAVGIISHVEELKNRVPVKLMVEPAEPGIRGTSVRMEYS